MTKQFLTIVLATLFLFSCEDLFQYSPYQVKIYGDERNQTQQNLELLAQKDCVHFEPFKIALFGDTHTFYDETVDLVSEINKRSDIDFAIHLGDITTSGTEQEFKWYSEIMNKLDFPLITIIGNHDYLSNGVYVYERMFGETNFTFTYNNCKFVIFDDVIWEKNVQDPDFDWFNKNLLNETNYTHVIPLSHIPPWDEQFSFGNELVYNYFLNLNNINLSIHGHIHEFDTVRPYPEMGEILYLSTDAINDRNYVLLSVEENNYSIEKVNF